MISPRKKALLAFHRKEKNNIENEKILRRLLNEVFEEEVHPIISNFLGSTYPVAILRDYDLEEKRRYDISFTLVKDADSTDFQLGLMRYTSTPVVSSLEDVGRVLYYQARDTDWIECSDAVIEQVKKESLLFSG